MLLQIVLISLVIALLIRRRLTFWSRQGIPNDVGLFFKTFRSPIFQADEETIKRNGKVVGIYNFLNPVLLVADAELAKKVLITDFHSFVNHMKMTKDSQHMGESVLMLKDDRWRTVRQMITPAFTAGKLKTMQPLMEDSCSQLTDFLDSTMEKPFDMKHAFSGFTMDVIASTAFGTKVNTIKDPNNSVAKNGRLFLCTDISLSAVLVLAMPSFAIDVLGLTFLANEPSQFFSDLTIDIVKRRRADPSLRRNDFVQFLIDAEHDGMKLTDKEIADNGIVFFLAGHDTSSITLTHAVYFLALNLNVQNKLIAEIDALCESSEIDYDTLNELKYLEAVINETLRFRTTATRTQRVASKDTMLGDVFVPKGTLVWLANHVILRDPDNFERPDEFLPERFLPDSKLRHNHHAFIPFAPGPRNCIGQRFAMFEMKLCLVRLLRQFTFEKCSASKVPLDYFAGQLVANPKKVMLKAIRRGTAN